MATPKMTVGEALRGLVLREAVLLDSDPYTMKVCRGDIHLLAEAGELAGTRSVDHPLTFADRIMSSIRQSKLFESRYTMSLPERGRGKIALYSLRKCAETDAYIAKWKDHIGRYEDQYSGNQEDRCKLCRRPRARHGLLNQCPVPN